MILRKLEEKDAPFMLEWMHDEDITAGFQRPFNQATIDTVIPFIQNSFDEENQNFAFVNDEDEYLGTISLKHISHVNDKAEYAVVARKCAQGTGVAKKATEELLEYAFTELGLHKVYLSVLEENIRAQKFYEKCGFVREGLEVDAVKINGVYHNHIWYGIRNSQNCIYKKEIKEFGQKMAKFPKRVYRHFESKKYLTGGYEQKLSILNTDETLSLLEKEQFSFLRYGDGEIAIMQGKSIPFQEYNPELAQKLKDMLRVKEKGIKVGIPYYYMHPLDSLNDFTKKFARALPAQRSFLCKNCSKDIIYIDTALTQVYQTYQEYEFAKYYDRMQHLLTEKDVTVVCGEGVLERLEHKALDVCRSVDYIYAPSMNAYAQYQAVLKKVMDTDKNRLVCVVLGPTAKVLVYDLAKAGYQAWDMGHYFKDYDAYLKKRPRTGEEIAKFYQPD